jgi:CHAT domain-containing protein
MVQQLTEPLDDFTRGSVDYLRIHYDLQLAHRLYNILLRDILETRKHKQELFIIPDRELFKLPFEALVTGFNREELDPDTVFSEYNSADYLIRDYAVSYFLSLFHLQNGMVPSGRRRYTISAFGCPSVRKVKNSRQQLFRPLPASREEILDIAAIFGKRQSRIFLANRFNKKNFEIFAPRSRVVHIATHFIANRQYPWYSALLFSPLKRDVSFDYCHAHEIFQLKLDADLVVLSACESSEKNLLGLQGLRGMTAAFRNAGARSMIVSMWPVDEHSCQLIPFFYREYREGKPIAAALRAAKLQLMTNAVRFDNGLKISFAHPFLWANYILYNFNY